MLFRRKARDNRKPSEQVESQKNSKSSASTQTESPSELSSQHLESIASFIQSYLNLSTPEFIQIQPNNSENSEHAISVAVPVACAKKKAALESELMQAFGVDRVDIKPNIPIFETSKPLVTNVKNIIAVSSGKGGVGKSATAVNLAYGLSAQGARVGILDADIYGPSIPIMLDRVDESIQSPDNKTMYPIEANGIVSNSIGYLVKNDHASIWRGPMASKALQQLINETQWPMLDYLIVDMPPGTGDIQLTMTQQLPLTCAIVVTTPQDIALSDAGKGIAMYEKLNIPVLGLIENMSYFECPNCQHQTAIFDSEGAQKLAEKYAMDVLAQIPLDIDIRKAADSGINIVEDAASPIGKRYLDVAATVSSAMVNKLALANVHGNRVDQIEITKLD